jgi:hypothetical protein
MNETRRVVTTEVFRVSTEEVYKAIELATGRTIPPDATKPVIRIGPSDCVIEWQETRVVEKETEGPMATKVKDD